MIARAINACNIFFEKHHFSMFCTIFHTAFCGICRDTTWDGSPGSICVPFGVPLGTGEPSPVAHPVVHPGKKKQGPSGLCSEKITGSYGSVP
jgi:hypothetical protein